MANKKTRTQERLDSLNHINKLAHTLERLVSEHRDEYELEELSMTQERLNNLHRAISNYLNN